MEKLAFKFDLGATTDAGEIAGYAAAFNNVDSYRDRIAPGAFTKTLSDGRKPKMLWMHDSGQPIGVWDELREDDRGLYAKGRIVTTTQLGREAYELLKAGAIDGLSIGYRTIRAEPGEDRTQILKEIDLFEVSLVTFPANDKARVVSIKQRLEEIKSLADAESILRDAGLSRSVSTAVVSAVKTFALRDAEAANHKREILSALDRATQLLNGGKNGTGI